MPTKNHEQFIESEIEEGLRRITHQEWDQYAPTISIKTIKKQIAVPFFLDSSGFFMKTLAASLFVCAYILFFYMPLNRPAMFGFGGSSIPTPQIPLSTATPSPQNTATKSNECRILYMVRDGDTLDGIAASFSTMPESIVQDNGLNAADMVPGTSLIIRACQFSGETSTLSPSQTITSTPRQ
jgi:hypothetical protein